MGARGKIAAMIVLAIGLTLLLIFGLHMCDRMQNSKEEPFDDETTNSNATQDTVADGQLETVPKENTIQTDPTSNAEIVESRPGETESSQVEPTKMPDKGEQGTDWI